MWNRTGALVEMIWVNREAEYFCKGGLDRANQLESKAEISILAQAVFASFRREGRANCLGRRFLFEGRASVHPWTQRTVEARRRVT
jgi:hypothetical protein